MIDVQSSTVSPGFAIESVGVTGLSYPLSIVPQHDSETAQQVTASFRLGVSLPSDQRGTHMSRFIAELDQWIREPADLTRHWKFTARLSEVLGSPDASVESRFTWFRRVHAPVSGQSALLEYKVAFLSVAGASAYKCLEIAVPAKALCPCSKAISDRGAHNQRSEITAKLFFAPDAPVPSFHKVIGIAELAASSPVYPLLKREDEKFVTEHAYDNPVFVEDLVRAAATRLADLPALQRFSVEARNMESIHAHDCYARISHVVRPQQS